MASEQQTDTTTSPTDSPAPKARETEQMGGFAKGLAVIEAFGNGRNSLTIADIARLTGLDRATSRRCVLTLVNTGYAITDGRQYQLTPRILRLGHAYLTASLPRLIQPSLEQLADALQESCSACVLDGPEIVYIGRATRHRLMGVGLHPGSRLPAYCTSMGRVLLAELPQAQARAILEKGDRPAITEKTLVAIDDLLQEFARIRQQGYALIDQELELGSRSVAVPVKNMAGQTIAAINVGVHASRATIEQLIESFVPKMLDTQAYLASILP